MARISEPLHVPVPVETAFDHVADFTTTAGWDPGITEARRLDDGPIGLGSRFEVRLRLGLATVPLVYEISAYERPPRVVLTTRGLAYRGEDDVRFESTAEGTKVTWNALFALRGPGLLLDPVLGVGFRRTAAKAVAGLERSLAALATR